MRQPQSTSSDTPTRTFLGSQPRSWHVPPKGSESTTATLQPAARQGKATLWAAEPLPTTTRSTSTVTRSSPRARTYTEMRHKLGSRSERYLSPTLEPLLKREQPACGRPPARAHGGGQVRTSSSPCAAVISMLVRSGAPTVTCASEPRPVAWMPPATPSVDSAPSISRVTTLPPLVASLPPTRFARRRRRA